MTIETFSLQEATERSKKAKAEFIQRCKDTGVEVAKQYLDQWWPLTSSKELESEG